MAERAFDFLFVLALVAPAVTVVIGGLLLALPRRHAGGIDHPVATTSRA